MAQMVKRLPAMRETWARFLGQEHPLEKEMAIHSSTLAWKIPWMLVVVLGLRVPEQHGWGSEPGPTQARGGRDAGRPNL